MNVFVVAAHADDEVLGPGATVHRLAREGAAVRVLIVAEGVATRHAGTTLAAVHATAEQAAEILGVRQLSFGGVGADGRLLEQHPGRELVALIERFLAQAQVDLLLTHHGGDVHVDHRAVARACAYAARSAGPDPARRRLAFEVLSSTEQGGAFVPTSFSRVSEADLDAKRRALAVYGDELRDFPHPRSLEGLVALARYRGVHLGAPLAEAFVVEREVW